jgi:hypothetical protein
MLNLIKIRPVEAALFHADGQMGRHDEADNHFSQFCWKRLKKECSPFADSVIVDYIL